MNNSINVSNSDIRAEIKAAGLYNWQVAVKLGIAESTFIRWLRLEMSDELKETIRIAIGELKEEQK